MRHPLFTLYGLILATAAGWTSWRDFSLSRVDQTTVAPKSIRDNPGAYRPIYIPHRRYFGGK
jgi:hypothetical protein